MKDLFVFCADADAMAVMRAVLGRHEELRIRALKYDVSRHTGKDSGMVTTGPELIRSLVKKAEVRRVLLIWDHLGSGWERRLASDESARRVQERLDSCTWQHASAAVAIDPELEEWLWHDKTALQRHLGISAAQCDIWTELFARRSGLSSVGARRTQPKELFEFICLNRLGRTITARDFESIARCANLSAWRGSRSFARVVELLRGWFPSG